MRMIGSSGLTPTIDGKIFDYLQGISRAPARVLMLDYDGTLAPFSIDPDRATPYPGIPALLRSLMLDTDTKLIVVSGRTARSAARLIGISGIEIWGCHGLERLNPDGNLETPELDPRSIQALTSAAEHLRDEGLEKFAEHKAGGIAIHWRGREVLAGHLTSKVTRVWSRLESRKGLRLVPFDCGIEIAVDLRNKGDVVRTVLSETGFDAAVAYLGDDTTDEDAFAALRGRGLNVLVREDYRKTIADVWIRPPDDVEVFLAGWRSGCRSA
jgi:trehalose 6-phosphate phosphatase